MPLDTSLKMNQVIILKSCVCVNASIFCSTCVCVQLLNTRRRLELLLEDNQCDYDPMSYYETTDQLLEPLLLCYESLVLLFSHSLF